MLCKFLSHSVEQSLHASVMIHCESGSGYRSAEEIGKVTCHYYLDVLQI